LKPIEVPLVALTSNNAIAKPQDANDIRCFVSMDRRITIYLPPDDEVESYIILQTPNGRYRLNKHSALNIYLGVCKGYKVHVSLKKIVGTLRRW